ncbi:protein JASON-like [Senna tora]|uniref:Protein JASON-like n=1 Tax=Senna tora TaxID=362788 RepID=A0A834T3L4_9FABA|nr:protein JASON-like [Senna tora]
MICFLVRPKLGFLFTFLLRFLHRSFAGPMGCFLSCFRAQDDDHLPTSHLVPDSSRSKSGAKFLDTYVSVAGNPAEIWKASGKSKVSPCSKDFESSSFRSRIPKTSIEKFQLEDQPSKHATPMKFNEERGNGKDTLEHTPSSSISIAQDTQCDLLCSMDGRSRTVNLHTAYRTCANETENNSVSASPRSPATDIKRGNKSVRFECENDSTSYAYKQSPYPTPLKLSDEMQTPGTVYPATLEDLQIGKPRVRSQIVYSNYNMGENGSQSKIFEEENLHPEQDSGEMSNSFEQPQNDTPTPKDGLKDISNENGSKVEGSVSYWLKPTSVIMEKKNGRMETANSQIPHMCKTPAERPIIGIVATLPNEDEDPQIPSPKWWDGNGIPNSTKKYKEDQKVNWHATPFEERLEKALSEKSSVISQSQSLADLSHIPFGQLFGEPSGEREYGEGEEACYSDWWDDISSRPSWKKVLELYKYPI